MRDRGLQRRPLVDARGNLVDPALERVAELTRNWFLDCMPEQRQ